MSLQYKLVAAAGAAFLALPAAAQEAAVEAGAKADTPVAQAQGEVDAGAQADAAAQADTAAEASAPADGSAADTTNAAAEGASAVTPATAADLRTGVTVQDPQGGVVGTIESVDADGAVVSTGNARAKMPVASFGRNDSGLVISMTRAELEAAISAQGGPEE